MSLKFKGELYVMTMKNDAKAEEKLTCQYQNLTRALENLKNLHFNPS